MKKHTKIYLDFFGLDDSDFLSCEICKSKGVDIHHINARGMGGNPKGDKDTIENLMMLCRTCHETYGDKKVWKPYLVLVHSRFLEKHLIHNKNEKSNKENINKGEEINP